MFWVGFEVCEVFGIGKVLFGFFLYDSVFGRVFDIGLFFEIGDRVIVMNG